MSNDLKRIVKEKINKKLQNNEMVILELGCGNTKKYKKSIGIDILDKPNVDVCGDVFEVLSYFPNESVDKITSNHFIEHIDNIGELVFLAGKVLKRDGVMEITAPHFSNPYYYSDPTHKSFLGLYTFCYFSETSLFKRKVPNYNIDIQFNLERVDLIFKTDRSKLFRSIFKNVIGRFFNLTSYNQELYEDSFCYIFPCYEIYYKLTRR
jgi:ubiquinone/menaquinone biosynthesis C-methylase UbiE